MCETPESSQRIVMKREWSFVFFEFSSLSSDDKFADNNYHNSYNLTIKIELILELSKKKKLNNMVMQENIAASQLPNSDDSTCSINFQPSPDLDPQ